MPHCGVIGEAALACKVPDALLNSLESYRKSLPLKRAAPEALVFSAGNGKPDLHMLRALKRNAKRAGLEPEEELHVR